MKMTEMIARGRKMFHLDVGMNAMPGVKVEGGEWGGDVRDCGGNLTGLRRHENAHRAAGL
jgi:hypothetical protein